MNTTFKTSSEKQLDQIRRFAKKNKIHHSFIQENGVYTITLLGLTSAETEKFIKSFVKTSNLTKPQQPEPESHAA